MEEKKIRILIANETYPPNLNGCAVFTQRLAQNLAKRGHEVAVVAPGLKFGDYLEKDQYGVNVYGLRSISVKMIHPNYRIVTKVDITKSVRKIIAKFQPDIIHIQNHFLVGRSCLKIAKKQGIAIVGTNHFMPENYLQFAPKATEGTMAKVLWADFFKVYNQLDCVTAPSRAAVQMLYDVGYKKKAEVVSNGMEFDKFKKRPTSGKLLKKYKLDQDIPTFISVGRIEKDKNLDVILGAFALYLEKNDGQLILVGNGKLEKDLKKLSVALGVKEKVVFTGKITVDEVFEVYSLADVYIGAGTAELQGLSVMEAMASGLPILVVNAVALPELVKDGANGYLFELSVADLAEKMGEILEDKVKIKEMGAKSLEIIGAHDMANTIGKFERIYEKVIKEKKKSYPNSRK
ncbi:MAG: glycosyltransferase [bacterium]|nr:glycosyltransferase [bacterium]